MQCPNCHKEKYRDFEQKSKDFKMFECLHCGKTFLSVAVKLGEIRKVLDFLGR